MAAFNNFGMGYNNYGIPQYPAPTPAPIPGIYQNQNQQMKYVHGIEGANAYQMAIHELEMK